MELEGSLRVFSLPEILQFLAMGQMNGTLTVKNETYSISLMFRDGRIVNSSTLDRPKKLGEMLVARGFIKRSELEEVLRLQQTLDTDKMLGQILVDRELVTDALLKDTLRLQLEEEIWELFSWDEGFFKFEHGDEKAKAEIKVEINIEPLLLEGTRRQDEWNKIRKTLPDEHIVVGIRKSASELDEELTLSDNEWKILSFVNGNFAISTIVDRSGLGRFDTFRILNSFIAAGLVELVDISQKISSERPREKDTEPVLLLDEKGPLPGTDLKVKEKSIRLLSGLFSKKSQQTDKAAQGSLKFLSPVGAASYGINELIQALMSQREFLVSEGDKKLMENFWHSIIMICPRADILNVYNNLIDVRKFERFIETIGMCDALRPIYEDCMHGLRRLLAAIYREGIHRLNEKNAHKTAITFIEETAPKVEITFNQNFNFMDFFMGVMEKSK